jgi:D-alanine-D-alanine ligase
MDALPPPVRGTSMAPLVLILYNHPLLPDDHPDSDSEHTIVGIADAMADILTAQGFRVSPLGLKQDPSVLWTELKRRKPDVVFNLFEGNLDDTETESYVAGLLQWKGVPFTGSPFPALTLARAKHLTKLLLRGAGLPTADFLVVDHLPVPPCALEWPVIVKPAKQDASVGLHQDSVCTGRDQLEQRVAYILETYGGPVLIEEYVRGREFNVALLELPDLQVLPPAEIVFPEERPGYWPILTYDGKWRPGTAEYDTTPPKFPADIGPRLAQKLGAIAVQAYRALGCRDYARVDFRVKPNGRPYILEVNPNPEISNHAGFAGCLGSADIPHPEFIGRLVRQALSRKGTPRPTFNPTGRDNSEEAQPAT